jgi:cell division protein FtsB
MSPATDTLSVKPLLLARRRQNPWLRRALIFATVAVLIDALVGERGLSETIRAGEDYARAYAQLRALKRENAALMNYATDLAHDPRTIEGVARKELGLIRPGEVLFVLKPVK